MNCHDISVMFRKKKKKLPKYTELFGLRPKQPEKNIFLPWFTEQNKVTRWECGNNSLSDASWNRATCWMAVICILDV